MAILFQCKGGPWTCNMNIPAESTVCQNSGKKPLYFLTSPKDHNIMISIQLNKIYFCTLIDLM